MKYGIALLLGLACAGVGWSTDLPAMAREQTSPLRVTQTVMPIFPRTALNAGITEGWARIVIDVDEAGILTDWLVVGHTRPEFGDASISAVREWKFAPMQVNGEAVPSQVAIGFRYEAKGVVIDITSGMDVARLWFRELRDKVYRPKTLQELDGIPVPKVWVEPSYPREFADRGITGSATVEFYIDESGVVRMPAVVTADFPELGGLLAAAVRQWSFEPPTERGRPVLVHASQTVTFGENAND